MIIPVKCFTCGKVLADKYRYYQQEVIRRKSNSGIPTDKVIYFNDLVHDATGDIEKDPAVDKSHEAHVMDELGLNKLCCRRHMLTQVDID